MITADEGLRGGRKIPLKVNADAAVKKAAGIVDTLIVVKRTGGQIAGSMAATSGTRTKWQWLRPTVRRPK